MRKVDLSTLATSVSSPIPQLAKSAVGGAYDVRRRIAASRYGYAFLAASYAGSATSGCPFDAKRGTNVTTNRPHLCRVGRRKNVAAFSDLSVIHG